MTASPATHDIFISYASADRERARVLANALEKRGWTVWWDREIPLGRSYDEVIEQALNGARCMLVLWTAASAASEWVRSEASEGKRRGMLVPVFLEEIDAPLAFRLLNGAQLENWDPAEPNAEFDRLTQRIVEMLAQSAPEARSQASPPFVPEASLPASGSTRAGADFPGQWRWKPWWLAAGAAVFFMLLATGGFFWLSPRSPLISPGESASPTASSPSPPAESAAPNPANDLTDLDTAPKHLTQGKPSSRPPPKPAAGTPGKPPAGRPAETAAAKQALIEAVPAAPVHHPAPQPAAVPTSKVAAATRPPTIVLAALGLPISRRFWSGEDSASYSRKMRDLVEKLSRDVLHATPNAMRLSKSEFDAWWNESGEHPRSRALCDTGSGPKALLSARMETPVTFSSTESAYWPELQLRLWVCGRQEIYRQQKTLSPHSDDAWPFSVELGAETSRFLREHKPDITD